MTNNRPSNRSENGTVDRRFVLRLAAGGGVAAAGIVASSNLSRAQEASPEPDVTPAASPVPVEAVGPQFAYAGFASRPAIEAGADPATTGISVYSINPDTGALTEIQALGSDNAFFFAFDPSERFLYVVNVIADYEGGDTGSVEAYAIDGDTGMLTFLNRQSSGGAVAAHLSVDPGGRHLVVANYNGMNFVVLPINEDGSLEPVISEVVIDGSGPNPDRQTMSHPHAVTYDPAGNFIAGADLGVDKVFIFRLNTETSELEQVSEVSTAPGAGPRHVAFNEEGTLLYVVNELNATITLYAYDSATGTIGEEIQTISTVPEPYVGTKSTAEIVIHQSGNFLYNSNRGLEGFETPEGDAIVAYTIDQETGELTLVQHQMDAIEMPENFAFDPTGTWLYAANANGISQHLIDQETGMLTFTGNLVETPKVFVILTRG